jgi:hypothetical protein
VSKTVTPAGPTVKFIIIPHFGHNKSCKILWKNSHFFSRQQWLFYDGYSGCLLWNTIWILYILLRRMSIFMRWWFTEFSQLRLNFCSREFHEWSVVDKMTLESFFLRNVRISLVSITEPKLHIHLHLYAVFNCILKRHRSFQKFELL